MEFLRRQANTKIEIGLKGQVSTSGDLEYEDLEVGLHHWFGIMDQSDSPFKL
jgi:hypothetical protein